jgi:hypothetical protein
MTAACDFGSDGHQHVQDWPRHYANLPGVDATRILEVGRLGVLGLLDERECGLASRATRFPLQLGRVDLE